MQFPLATKFGFEAWDVPLGLLLTKWTRNVCRQLGSRVIHKATKSANVFFDRC